MGSIDKDGFFVFQGRDADNININGVNYNLKNIEEDLKKFFKIKNIKILNITSKIAHFDHKLYLFMDKKIEVRSIYTYLKKSNTNINFEKVFVTKEFVLNKTGKININNLVKKVNGKK